MVMEGGGDEEFVDCTDLEFEMRIPYSFPFFSQSSKRTTGRDVSRVCRYGAPPLVVVHALITEVSAVLRLTTARVSDFAAPRSSHFAEVRTLYQRIVATHNFGIASRTEQQAQTRRPRTTHTLL